MTEEIRFTKAGGVATIELARPKALNALTYPMVQHMAERLTAWEDLEDVGAVIIKGEGERAFCAGGDVRAVWRSVMEDNGGVKPSELSKVFFFDEYRLNHQIHAFSKPYVALLDGVAHKVCQRAPAALVHACDDSGDCDEASRATSAGAKEL